MNVQQLKTFVEVAHHGSFAEAARRLDMAPSAVSRAVAALEASLGARLLQRNTHRVSLSDAGAAYYEQVVLVLEALERAADQARSASGEVQGVVRLTATVAFGQALVVPLLGELHSLHPALELELHLADHVVDLVAERIDLAIRLGPPADTSLIGARLAPLHYRVCASPDYLQRHGQPAAPQALADHTCLRFPKPGFRTQWAFQDPEGHVDVVDVHGWLVVSSAMALRRAALDGLGVAMLGHWLVDADIAAGRLVNLFPAYQLAAPDFGTAAWLLYPSRAYVPRRVRAVIDFLKARLTA
ncbi:LysR family transcriptional regulator [Ottowia sp. GY511]|nr:LysR family transcriptional regulator [Ottowia sp. GY511]